LIEKDRLVGLPLRRRDKGTPTDEAARVSVAKKATTLGLPDELRRDALPGWTVQAIQALHEVAVDGRPEFHRDIERGDGEVRARYYVATRRLSTAMCNRFMETLGIESNTLSTARSNYGRACGIKSGAELDLLLSDERRFDQTKFQRPRVKDREPSVPPTDA
jgi:hypothetical protein